ncbi:caspase family protein [Geomesophilobacter sediminis]|uniref:Caspase family protein n=1 Tax=Geomesophilobacter sediminis TaxID=2798584 RepID=A0A8J7M1A5_9BACT|nr:caspase family protein [Geomesophilobacter sediminis]MBJ6726845.1 caspase family protein [Geomesophilobacter sediminis]
MRRLFASLACGIVFAGAALVSAADTPPESGSGAGPAQTTVLPATPQEQPAPANELPAPGADQAAPGSPTEQAAPAASLPAAVPTGPLERGLANFQAKRYPEALAALNAAVEKDPQAKDALLTLGIMHEQGLGVAQNHVEAARYYRRAWKAGSPEAYERLSALYHQATKPEDQKVTKPSEPPATPSAQAAAAVPEKIVLELPAEALLKLYPEMKDAPKEAKYQLAVSCEKGCANLQAQAQEMAQELGATVLPAQEGGAAVSRSADQTNEEVKIKRALRSRKLSIEDGANPDELTINVTCTGWCNAIKKVAQAVIAVFEAATGSGTAERAAGTFVSAGASDTRALSAKFSQGKSYALIIGINEYKNINKLKNAVNDAKVMDEVLRDYYGFQNTVLIDQNATRDNIMKALNDLRKTLTENDSLIIFYSGHGEFSKETGTSYWLPVDAAIDDNTKWLESRSISDQLKLISSKHVLIIADSCYSGTMTRASEVNLSGNATRENYLNKLFTKPSRVLIASGGNEPVTDAGGQGHSIFSDVLIRALKEPFAGVFTAEELMTRHLKEAVAGRTEQTPEYKVVRNSGHDGGDFIFVKKK